MEKSNQQVWIDKHPVSWKLMQSFFDFVIFVLKVNVALYILGIL